MSLSMYYPECLIPRTAPVSGDKVVDPVCKTHQRTFIDPNTNNTYSGKNNAVSNRWERFTRQYIRSQRTFIEPLTTYLIISSFTSNTRSNRAGINWIWRMTWPDLRLIRGSEDGKGMPVRFKKVPSRSLSLLESCPIIILGGWFWRNICLCYLLKLYCTPAPLYLMQRFMLQRIPIDTNAGNEQRNRDVPLSSEMHGEMLPMLSTFKDEGFIVTWPQKYIYSSAMTSYVSAT